MVFFLIKPVPKTQTNYLQDPAHKKCFKVFLENLVDVIKYTFAIFGISNATSNKRLSPYQHLIFSNIKKLLFLKMVYFFLFCLFSFGNESP